MAQQYGGWTGKTLRVDLSTGTITTEDTIAKWKDYLGGQGLGYKVMWDEVPPGTKAFDPANRVIFATGPATGTGAPSTGRTSITSLLPYAVNELPGSGHMGGHWGSELKYAGWDAIIVQGKAATPVWMQIIDDQVTLVDAQGLWGNGVIHTADEICTIMGAEAHVAAIGQVGENLSLLSCIVTDRCHIAGGGLGAVMGSKNLKAIGVKGSGSVKIAADKATWKSLNQYYLSLIGANNNHVVPKAQQPWAEYYDSTSRWSANKGVFWGAANPEVETGYCTDFEHPLPTDCPSPQNKIGLRTQKGFNDFGIPGMNHTVKMNGCHACPIRCHISMDVQQLEQYGVSRYNEETCVGYTIMSGLMSTNSAFDSTVINNNMSTNVANDFGFWTDYGGYSGVYHWCYTHVMTAAECSYLKLDPSFVGKTPFQNNLPAAELTVLSGNATGSKPYTANTPWANADAGNPYALQQLMYLIANKASNSSTPVFAAVVANGPAYWASKWPEVAFFNDHCKSSTCFKMGHQKHHGVESFGQVGVLINSVSYNRDPMNHTHQNITVGPPLALRNTIMMELFSSPTAPSLFKDTAGSTILCDASAAAPYAPMTMGKAAFAAACMISLEIKNSLVHCDWMFPTWMSPLKSKNYRGDFTIEAQLYSAVTGDTITANDLELIGLRNFTLFRALNARFMDYFVKQSNSSAQVNMRTDHDTINDWMFETTASPANAASGNTDCYPASNVPFTAGTQLMDRADMETARNMLYQQLGWDKNTGMPTAATLTRLGLDYVKTTIPALIVA